MHVFMHPTASIIFPTSSQLWYNYDMITYDNMIESIQIFRRYTSAGSDLLPLEPYDGQLYLNVPPSRLLEEDINRLEEIGWFAETDYFTL